MDDIDIVLQLAFTDEEDSSSSSSSSSLSSDSDFELLTLLTNERKLRTKIENYVERTVDAYTEEEFRKHFRMSRTTANFCIDLITNANVLSDDCTGRKKVAPKNAFLLTLWYLSNQETFRQVSDRFNVTESCCHNIVKKVVNYIVKISPNYVKWPPRDEQIKIESEFLKKQGMKGIVGSVDGSHITINRPNKNQETYCNRKGTHSIILQGIVDHKRQFLDVFCGEPGSLHDARVLKKSSFYEKAVNNSLDLEDRYILGDSAYPSLPWLVPPFKDNGHLTIEERDFNFKHSSTRIVVENAFGLLKGRFRRLRHFDNRDINFIVKCVVAACTLHNICLNMDNSDENIELFVDDV